ncbi:type III secretion system protein [Erwinia tracheiphila]
MSLWGRLRRYDANQTPLERQMHQHADSKIVSVHNESRYLLLSLLEQQFGEKKAYIDVDCWLDKMEMQLPGIPWRQVPLSYLVRWFTARQISFLVEEKVWQVQSIAVPDEALPEQLLMLPAQPCALLCSQWPGNLENNAKSRRQLYGQMAFVLQYILGRSQLPLSMLVDVGVGDLILITHYSPFLAIGKRRLFTFIYHQYQEVIVEQECYENDQERRAEEEISFQWTQLPVDIEFVLDDNTVTLEDLENIVPGVVLPLSPSAERGLKFI